MSTSKKQKTQKTTLPLYSSKDNGSARKKARVEDNIEDDVNRCKIWLNNKLVVRPNYTTSYGILFYREAPAKHEFFKPKIDCQQGFPTVGKTKEFQYLLGLIPQGTSWTVFKGLAENDEQPEETAIREFEEESSLDFPYDRNDWKNCPVKSELYGVTSAKKLLQIFLIPSSPKLKISKFNIDKVIKIDSGRFSGLPEIIDIKFLTAKQAIDGIPGRGKSKAAKIYKSQVSVLERADAILNNMV